MSILPIFIHVYSHTQRQKRTEDTEQNMENETETALDIPTAANDKQFRV